MAALMQNAVARIERSEIRGNSRQHFPGFALLNPGYD
jgi:hypothetical protein